LTGALAASNAISYTTPTINGFSAGYLTSLTGPAERTNERETLNINYAKGPLMLTFIDIKGGTNTAANGAFGAAISAPADTATKNQAVGASYDFGVARLSLVNSLAKNAAGVKTADIMSIGATVPMGAYTILAGYNKAKTGTGYTATEANDTKIALGVNYALSKRTTLGADLFKAEAVNAGTGFVVRARHTF
jgi:predicted porin